MNHYDPILFRSENYKHSQGGLDWHLVHLIWAYGLSILKLGQQCPDNLYMMHDLAGLEFGHYSFFGSYLEPLNLLFFK